jgi:hypothetical protein
MGSGEKRDSQRDSPARESQNLLETPGFWPGVHAVGPTRPTASMSGRSNLTTQIIDASPSPGGRPRI